MRPPATESEERLIERARGGDRAAFEELVRRHADRLHSVVLRFTADEEEAREVLQETFLRAWRGIERFRGGSKLFTWLYRIGINEAKRRAGRRPPPELRGSADEDPGEEAPDWSRSPEVRVEAGELRRSLEAAIRELPPGYRATVILRDVEGLSTREAAEVMGLGEAAFKSRLHRARTSIRRALGDRVAGEEGSES